MTPTLPTDLISAKDVLKVMRSEMDKPTDGSWSDGWNAAFRWLTKEIQSGHFAVVEKEEKPGNPRCEHNILIGDLCELCVLDEIIRTENEY